MSTVFSHHPIFSFIMPSFVPRSAKPTAAASASVKPAGLACTDIADVSARATAKGGLRERPAALRKLYP